MISSNAVTRESPSVTSKVRDGLSFAFSRKMATGRPFVPSKSTLSVPVMAALRSIWSPM